MSTTFEYVRDINGNLVLVELDPLVPQDPDNIFNPVLEAVNTKELCMIDDQDPSNEICIKAEDPVTSDYKLCFPKDEPAAGDVLEISGISPEFNSFWTPYAAGAGFVQTSDVSVGNTQVPVYDGITGNIIKTTSVTIDGSDNMAGIVNLTASNIGGLLEVTTPILTLDAGSFETNIDRPNLGVSHTLTLPGTLLGADQLLQFDSGGIGSYVLRSSFLDTPLNFTAIEDNTFAFQINCDAAGFNDVQALNISYTTGAIIGGDIEAAILVNIDEDLAVDSAVVAGLAVLSTDTGAADVKGLICGTGVSPLVHQSGTFGDATVILVLAVDETTDLSGGGGGNVGIFTANSDTVTIQDVAQFSEMAFLLGTVASGAGINPLFEFSSGSGPTTWTAFNPLDGTNGMRSSGVILWTLSDITSSWVVGDSGNFEIRITRQRVTVTTPPIADQIAISSPTEYGWDSNADLTVSRLTNATGNRLEIRGNHTSFDSLQIQTTNSGGIDMNSDGNLSMNCVEDFDLIAAGTATGDSEILKIGSAGNDLNIGCTSGSINITAGESIADSIKLSSTNGGIQLISSGDVDINETIIYNDGSVEVLAQSELWVSDTAGRIGWYDSTFQNGGIRFEANTSAVTDQTFVMPLVAPTLASNEFASLSTDSSSQLFWRNTGLPTEYIKGFLQQWSSVTTVSFGLSGEANVCRDADDTVDISISGQTNVVITTSGLNGLSSTYTEAANQGYDIYVIFDSTGVETTGFLMIEEGDDITTVAEFVSDYNKFRLVGWIRNDTSNILEFWVNGKDSFRQYYWVVDKDDIQVLSAGAATSYTDLSITSFMMPLAEMVILYTEIGDTGFGTLANFAIEFRPNGNTGIPDTDYGSTFSQRAGDPMDGDNYQGVGNIKVPTSDRIVEYRIVEANDEGYVWVMGFEYNL